MSIILQDSWKIGFVINLRYILFLKRTKNIKIQVTTRLSLMHLEYKQDLKLENIKKSDNYEQHPNVKKRQVSAFKKRKKENRDWEIPIF